MRRDSCSGLKVCVELWQARPDADYRSDRELLPAAHMQQSLCNREGCQRHQAGGGGHVPSLRGRP